jgi:hypothetical protein
MLDLDRRHSEWLLTADYWDGHTLPNKGDSSTCETATCTAPLLDASQHMPYPKLLKAKKIAKEMIVPFHPLSDREPLREFKEGGEFVVGQFSHGTIVEFDLEQLTRVQQGRPPQYSRRDMLGIIYEGQDKERVLLGFESTRLLMNRLASLSPFIDAPVYTFTQPVKIDTVSHYKTTNSDALLRIKSLALYKVGEGARQHARRRIVFKWHPQAQPVRV